MDDFIKTVYIMQFQYVDSKEEDWYECDCNYFGLKPTIKRWGIDGWESQEQAIKSLNNTIKEFDKFKFRISQYNISIKQISIIA